MNYFENVHSQAQAKKPEWIVQSVNPESDIRFVVRGGVSILQQRFCVRWNLPKEEFRAFDGFVTRDTTYEWLDVPTEEE